MLTDKMAQQVKLRSKHEFDPRDPHGRIELGSSCLTAVYTAASAYQCIHIHTLHKQTLLNGGVQRWLFLTHFTNCQQESLVNAYSHNILPLSAVYSFHWFNIVCGDYIWINKTKLCPNWKWNLSMFPID